MPLRSDMEPQEYLGVFRRRIWNIVLSVVLVMFGASIYCVVTPDQYESSTTILVIPQDVPQGYVGQRVSYSLEERQGSIEAQVLSRTRLVSLVDELGLFREKRKEMSADAMVSLLRERIQFRLNPKRNTLSVSFVYEDPQTTMVTATKLASFFVEENLKSRRRQSESTSEFLGEQLKETKAKLEAQEEKVKRYKMQFMGELPQQIDANLSRLARLQDQLKTNAEVTARLEDRKILLGSQIRELGIQISTLEEQGTDSVEPLIRKLEEKSKTVEELSAKYTERYPTVIELRRQVELLERQIADIQASGPPEPEKAQGETARGLLERPRKATAQRNELVKLQAQVRDLNLEIDALRREKEVTRNEIDSIQKKVERMPEREQEMIALTRDYENIKISYENLLKKKLEAGISGSLEEGQRGEQFQIIDPANFPTLPVRPDRMRILGLAFLAALALGFGGAIGMEMLDSTLRDAKDFRYFFDLPVLATLPVVEGGEFGRKYSVLRAMLLIGITSVTLVVTIILLVYRTDVRTILASIGGGG